MALQRWLARPAAALIGALVVVSCGGRTREGALTDGEPQCIAGQQIACACFDGADGAQVCSPQGAYEACVCKASSGNGSGGTQSTGSGDGGGTAIGTGARSSSGGSSNTGGSSSIADGGDATVLSSGTQTLVDLFVTEAGVLLVFTDEIRLVSRAGTTLNSLSSSREITAAAFEGSTLVVTDKAKFTSYDSSLQTIVSANLATGCSSAVLIDGGRFVCGQDVDWDRVYYTYDTQSGALLASSIQYTYEGLTMRRVPGLNEFVAVEVESSPANLFLYQVGADGEASILGGSDFETSDPSAVYAFVGNPATQVVVQDGAMLDIPGDACNGAQFSEGCLSQHGELGTLTGSQTFIGMDSDSSGQLYTLVDLSPSFDAHCGGGCTAQHIDVASRSVVRQSLHNLGTISGVIGVRYDSFADTLIAGCSTGDRYATAVSDPQGHRVVSLAY